jgi:prolipoprotein diacylglyceryltransferase
MFHISTSHADGVHYYMLFYLAAILTGITGAAIAAYKRDIHFKEFAVIISVSLLSVLIGSKMVKFDSTQWFSLFNDGHLPVENGKSVLGAIAGGLIGLWIVGKIIGKKKAVLDLFAVSFPLGMAVQRIGCLLAGCCHGIVTSMPWGITYGPGSKPYMDQLQLGLIPADASVSLAIHPIPIYNILACIFVAILASTSSSRWKSPSGKIIFLIILFLVFRFGEEFLRYSVKPETWLGIKPVQWIVLSFIFILSALLFYREHQYARLIIRALKPSIPESGHSLKIFMLSILTLAVSYQIRDWLTSDEKMVVVFILVPLCGLVILEILLRLILSQKLIKVSSLVAIALLLMSQKADQPTVTPESYTALNISTAFGKFNLEHEFNPHTMTSTGYDCDGNPFTYLANTYNYVPVRHAYGTGGLGISRKKYYSPWRSTLTSVDIYAGSEAETPYNYPDSVYVPSAYHNALWSICPMVQYDARGIGLGLGVSMGLVGYDKPYDLTYPKIYEPKYAVRNFALQGRLRLFSERYFFVEGLLGYDAGAIGDYNWQFLAGSRFNSDKYLLKTGMAWANHSNTSFVIQGQMPLFSSVFLSPEIIFYNNKNNSLDGGYRAVLGLQYRLYDKVKKKTTSRKH